MFIGTSINIGIKLCMMASANHQCATNVSRFRNVKTYSVTLSFSMVLTVEKITKGDAIMTLKIRQPTTIRSGYFENQLSLTCSGLTTEISL